MNLEGKKVLVTGSSGLIGSNLIKRLKTIPNINLLCNINTRELDDPNLQVAFGTLLDTNHCDSITKDIDVVFHCAAQSYGAAFMDASPTLLIKDNILMNINLLEACYKNNVKKFIWLASTTGYPETNTHVTEDMMFDGNPHDKYFAVGWMKRYTETLCELFSDKLKKQLPCIVLRPSNIYGPNDKIDPKKSHVLAALLRKVAEKQNPIEIWGDGKDLRDVLYVDDMVDAMILAAEKIETFEQFNIGLGRSYSILELLEKIKTVANYDAEYKLIPSGPRMIAVRNVSIQKAHDILGWTPKTPIDVGIEKTYSWITTKI